MTKKLWGGRFKKQTHPIVESYTASIGFDAVLAHEDIVGSLAHAGMLRKCKFLTLKEHQKIQSGLNQILEEVKKNKVQFNLQDEDIHMNIERMLHEKIGDVAGKLHTARSRNDQVALDLHLYLRKQILTIIKLLIDFQEALLKMAKRDVKIILPGYTHLQRAQPVSLSQHWLAYVSMFARDTERLQDCFKRMNFSPLGACALNGSSLNTDKEFVAKSLGFEGLYANNLDAVSNRDFVIEFLSAASLIMMHFSRLSEELILWASQEFNFIHFDEAFSTGSSMMPQKKNPDVAELARGKTGRVYGALMSVLTMMKGLPLAYNKDLQEDKEPLFDSVKTLRQTLIVFKPMLLSLKINAEVMKKSVKNGFLNATLMAEYLVKKGITFRKAHEVVGKMVAYCELKKISLEDLPIKIMKDFSGVVEKDVYTVINPFYSHPDFLKSLQKELKQSLIQIKHCREWLITKCVF